MLPANTAISLQNRRGRIAEEVFWNDQITDLIRATVAGLGVHVAEIAQLQIQHMLLEEFSLDQKFWFYLFYECEGNKMYL